MRRWWETVVAPPVDSEMLMSLPVDVSMHEGYLVFQASILESHAQILHMDVVLALRPRVVRNPLAAGETPEMTLAISQLQDARSEVKDLLAAGGEETPELKLAVSQLQKSFFGLKRLMDQRLAEGPLPGIDPRSDDEAP